MSYSLLRFIASVFFVINNCKNQVEVIITGTTCRPWETGERNSSELLGSTDATKAGRVMHAMLQMKKIDIAGLEKASKPSPFSLSLFLLEASFLH